jgi:methionyl-tRNA formyltransferase
VYVSNRTQKSLPVIIARAAIVREQPADLPQGVLDENLNVVCGSSSLKILQIKPAGSRLMSFKDFVNGQQTQPGDVFAEIDN